MAASPGLDHVSLCALMPSLLSLIRHGLTLTPTAGTHRFPVGSLGPHTGLCRAGRGSGSAVLQSHGDASSPASTRWGEALSPEQPGLPDTHTLYKGLCSPAKQLVRGAVGLAPPPYSLTTAVQEHGVLTLSDLRIHPHGVLQVKGNFKKCHYPTV